jgi:hypothetical protein
MARTKREKRLVVRLAGPLEDELKAAAERDGRPVSGLVRKILTDVVIADRAERGSAEAALGGRSASSDKLLELYGANGLDRLEML